MYDLEGAWIWEIRPHKREFLMKKNVTQSEGDKDEYSGMCNCCASGKAYT